MKIIAILVVRDEEDIIELTLTRFSEQFDSVYVYDTGSADTTYEIVQSIAKTKTNIVLVGNSNIFFSDAIRGTIWEITRKHLSDGDWFARVDADEIYHIAPKDFISSFTQPWETIVYCQYYDFQPTADELPFLSILPDLKAEERLRHYRVSPFQGEGRLFKYRSSMCWVPGENGPRDPGIIAANKIPVRHYPARSKQQLMKRVILRQIMFAENPGAWGKPKNHHWQLNFNEFLGQTNDPNLHFWKPDTIFPLANRKDHLPPTKRGWRAMLEVAFVKMLFIRLKDKLRALKQYPAWNPTLMNQQILQTIKSEYSNISQSVSENDN